MANTPTPRPSRRPARPSPATPSGADAQRITDLEATVRWLVGNSGAAHALALLAETKGEPSVAATIRNLSLTP